MDPRRLQDLCRILGPEVGIDDVQVRNADLLSLGSQQQGVVHGNVGLAAAIMACK